MKKELKGFIIGVILTMAFSVSANVWQSISVQPNSVNIVVNGEKINVDNFLYNDTTYIPIRAVSTALSQDVSYDDKTNTAYIGKKGIDKVETEELKPQKLENEITFDVNGRQIATEGVYYDENGVKYCPKDYFIQKLMMKNTYIDFITTNEGSTNESYNVILRSGKPNSRKTTDEIIKENIPFKNIENRIMISEKYFTEEILPIDK